MRQLVLPGVLAACAVAASPAGAVVEGGPEYRSQVEPICKANAEKTDTPHPVPARIRREGDRRAARWIFGASKELRRTHSKLRAVERPAEDAQRLSRWLEMISEQARLLREVGDALIDEERRRAQRIVIKLSNRTRKLNVLVLAYEFRHCVFKEVGFTLKPES